MANDWWPVYKMKNQVINTDNQRLTQRKESLVKPAVVTAALE
jgi:hypothetical protein